MDQSSIQCIRRVPSILSAERFLRLLRDLRFRQTVVEPVDGPCNEWDTIRCEMSPHVEVQWKSMRWLNRGIPTGGGLSRPAHTKLLVTKGLAAGSLRSSHTFGVS